ncbi:MAG: low molecular weight protein arginine phosphatase [Tissierellia bacterium]|nr:low molecular weight protein arginine phosphatase [Tissierellia bacterium]
MNLLFLCTGNTCRSPVAKILGEKMADERGLDVSIRSRGFAAIDGEGMSRGSLAVLAQEGIDGSFHRAKTVGEEDLTWAHRIYTMTQGQKAILERKLPQYRDKIFLLGEEDIADPIGGGMEEYRAMFQQMEGALEELLDNL